MKDYNYLFSTNFEIDKKEAYETVKREKQQQIELIEAEIIEKRKSIGKLFVEYDVYRNTLDTAKIRQTEEKIDIERGSFGDYIQEKSSKLRALQLEINYIDSVINKMKLVESHESQ